MLADDRMVADESASIQIVPRPIRVRAPITTFGKTTQPGSRIALGATTADGWTSVARTRPSSTSRSTSWRRRGLPIAGRIGNPGSNAA